MYIIVDCVTFDYWLYDLCWNLKKLLALQLDKAKIKLAIPFI